MAKIQQDDLAKAMDALRDLAKGHSSRGTVTTQVDTMRDGSVGAGSGAGATQVFHTPSNSDPGGWAGSKKSDVADDGATDHISENATDLDSVSEKVFKSIVDKIAKGEALSLTERAFMKSYAAGMVKKDDDDDDDDDKKDFKAAKFGKAKSLDDDKKEEIEKGDMKILHDGDDDGKFGKSLRDYASENEDVSKGLEVSEFLASFADVFHKSIAASEARIMAHVSHLVSESASDTGSFQKSLAESVVRLGEAVAATAQRVEQVESAPARGAKSVGPAGALSKGSYAGPANLESIDKSVVGSVLFELNRDGQCSVEDVVRFDSTGQISDGLSQKVYAKLNGR